METKTLPRDGIVVGIDIGIRKNVGWAVVNLQAELVDSGVFELDTKKSFEERLASINRIIQEFIIGLEFGPHFGGPLWAVGIETPWVGKNIQTALKLGKVWATCAQPFFDYVIPYTIYPTTAKKALTGSGKATKYGMVEAAALMGMPHTRDDRGEVVGNDNEADAIGVALAALNKWREDYLVG